MNAPSNFDAGMAQAQYYSRPEDECYETLAELQQAVTARHYGSRETVTDAGSLRVVATGEHALTVEHEEIGLATTPTHWAFGQVATLAKAPADFIRQLPAPMAANVLNHQLHKRDETQGASSIKLLTREQAGNVDWDAAPTLDLAAVTSDTYGRIWDDQVVNLAQELVEHSGGALYNPPTWKRRADGSRKPGGLYASDRDVFMFLIDGGSIVDAGNGPEGVPDQLHRGVYLWNSETGSKTFGLDLFMFRAVCGNFGLWGIEHKASIRIRHNGRAPEHFERSRYNAIRHALDAPVAQIEHKIRLARELMLPTDAAELWEAVAPAKITRAELAAARHLAKHEEGDCRTAWQLYQGLTRYARDMAHTDSRIDLERRASKLMERLVPVS